MQLRQQILTRNDCYKAGRTIQVKGVMVHSTGANNPRTERYTTAWDAPGVEKCVHAFVGLLPEGGVGTVQTLPWNRRGWHCGSGKKGSGNDTHIAFEICEDGLTDPDYFQAVYREAVELTAYLCRLYGLDPLADGVVICHQEGWQRGIASNHADVLHWFPKFGKTMDGFRADAARAMDNDDKEDEDMTCYKTISDVPVFYRAAIQKLLDKGALAGTGDGLDLSDDLCRTLTILDRLGKLD